MSDEQCVAIIAAILSGSHQVAREIFMKDDDSASWDCGDISDYIADARRYLAAAQPGEEPHA